MLEVEDGCEVVGDAGIGTATVSLVDGLAPDLMLVTPEPPQAVNPAIPTSTAASRTTFRVRVRIRPPASLASARRP
jgi:hypothetical protein